MKQLIAIIVVLIVAALTYTLVTLLTGTPLSEPGVLPIVAGIAVGTLTGGIIYMQRKPKA